MLHKSILACAALLLLATPSEARPTFYFPASACALPGQRDGRRDVVDVPTPVAADYWSIKHAISLGRPS